MSTRLRWKRARIILDQLKSLLYAWDCRTRRLHEIPAEWRELSCFTMPIRMRLELGSANRNRIDNMRMACSFISGTVLDPGRVFSMFRIVGDPSDVRGFKPGPVIVQGKLVLETGGGLCQISTSLFNAALTGNLEILEKRNHTTDIWGEHRMVDLGRDAAYVYGLSDLKFRNSTGKSIALVMEIDETALLLHCRVFGPEPLHGHVRIMSKQLTGSGSDNRVLVQTTRFFRNAHKQETVTYQKTESYCIPERTYESS